MNRTPPKSVQELLRQEVNFGCPVSGCGIPYLTWHHFDPPWRDEKHHNPEGMIALCAKDAELADGGRWTKQELRQMKKNPFVTSDRISEYYGYLRKNVVCMIGNVAYNVKNALEICGERIIGFEIDDKGYNRLNLLIRNRDGVPILEMKNNFWTAVGRKLFDLRCSPQGKELEIISRDKQTNFSMRFDDYPLDVFRDKLLRFLQKTSTAKLPNWLDEEENALATRLALDSSSVDEFISYVGSPESVPTWTIKGRLFSGNVHLEIRDSEIEDLLNHNIFTMNFVLGGKSAFSFCDGSMAIGISGN